jgi:outer membrane protein TolC
MPDDTGMARAPRRTAAYRALEERATALETARRDAILDLHAAHQALADARTAHADARTRARHAEHLLRRAVAALGEWRNADGDLDARAADVLTATLADVLGPTDAADHAEHPDDDEPPHVA